MILLTGASGFIGSHLLRALSVKYGKQNIVALTSKPLEEYNYILHNNYNFTDDYIKSKFPSIEVILHAGSYIPKKSSESNNLSGCLSNIQSCERLINQNLPNLKKIIYLSTSDVYACSEIINENTPVQPVSLYGDSKLFCEKLIHYWSLQNNKKREILRIGHVYGPGEERYYKVIPEFIRRILRGQVIEIYGNGEEKRSFIYIEDVVNSILTFIEKDSEQYCINIVSDQVVTIAELLELLRNISKKEMKVLHQERKTPKRDLIFDNSILRKYYIPKINLIDGLKNEVKYFAENEFIF